MHKIVVIRLYFLLDTLYVSEYISLSSGATLYAVPRTWYIPVYTNKLIKVYANKLIKVAPEDGLI